MVFFFGILSSARRRDLVTWISRSVQAICSCIYTYLLDVHWHDIFISTALNLIYYRLNKRMKEIDVAIRINHWHWIDWPWQLNHLLNKSAFIYREWMVSKLISAGCSHIIYKRKRQTMAHISPHVIPLSLARWKKTKEIRLWILSPARDSLIKYSRRRNCDVFVSLLMMYLRASILYAYYIYVSLHAHCNQIMIADFPFSFFPPDIFLS
jgi:hypothetical protein